MKKLAATLAAAIILLGCGFSSEPSKPVGKPDTAASASTNVEPAKSQYGTPTAKDYTLKVKTLRKACFGSAGCNVTFRVELTKVGTVAVDPDKTYELTYEVTGGEDPMTNTMEITGDQYNRPDEEVISTKSSKSVLKATVTSIAEQ